MNIQWTTIQPIKGNEILPCAAMWTDLDSVMLSEISWVETNTGTHHLSVESKKKKCTAHGKAETDPQIHMVNLFLTR